MSARLPILGVDDLFTLPQPAWLVAEVLPEQAFAGLYGPTDSFKSFLALSWALCVASGVPWHGHAVKRGRVVLVYAEGAYNLRERVDAWLKYSGLDREALRGWLYIIPQGCDLTGEPGEVEALEAAVQSACVDQPLALLVLDTLNRCFGGGDENSSVDMTRFVASCDRLKAALGCAVLVNHHTGYDTSHARGSTVLKASADAFLAIHKIGQSRIRLAFEKRKMAGARNPIVLDLVGVPEAGSCVLVPDGAAASGPTLNDRQLAALRTLKPDPLPFGLWREQSSAATTTLNRWKDEFLGQGWITGGGAEPWALTDAGRRLVGNGTDPSAHSLDCEPPSSNHSLPR